MNYFMSTDMYRNGIPYARGMLSYFVILIVWVECGVMLLDGITLLQSSTILFKANCKRLYAMGTVHPFMYVPNRTFLLKHK